MDNKLMASGNWFLDQLNVFQAANSNIDSIKKNFIVRQEEFQTIIDSIKVRKKEDSLQHELILGRRGSGKSTLLKRVEIGVKENPALQKKYFPIYLAEEQAGIYRLFDLWEQVLNELEARLKKYLSLRDYSEFQSDDDYTRYLYEEIRKLCIKNNKQVILLLDNFDRIVENFSDDGNLLRETLINFDDVLIIGGSTRMDEHFWRYDMPFYDFFRVHRLEGLSSTEIKKLLTHWSDSLDSSELKTFIQNNPGKLENVRILTDGLPRTLQFFIQMVLQKEELNSYDYLKKIMDNVSPLFQERLNSLPAPLRKIVLEMAFIWEASSVKQLAEKVKMESKLVSANLKVLINKGIVDKIATDTKNNLYRLSERFFNLWIIVTQGNPEQKRKARWLSIYLENFYDVISFKKMHKEYLLALKAQKISRPNALLFSKALAQSKFLTTEQSDEVISLTGELTGSIVAEPNVNFSRKYYQRAIDEGANAYKNLGLLYYDQNSKKEKALTLIRETDRILVQIVFEIWNGIFDHLENRIIQGLDLDKPAYLEWFLTEMLVHQQKNLILKLFRNPNFGEDLQKKYMILYYATLMLTQKEDKNLKLKIPPELNSTIDKVLERIEKRAVFYGYGKKK